MLRLYVGITDFDWFRFLRDRPHLAEVNFWQPGGERTFRGLRPGELFLFKLHSPRDYVVGGGVFAHATILPVSLAWDTFGEANGAASLWPSVNSGPSSFCAPRGHCNIHPAKGRFPEPW